VRKWKTRAVGELRAYENRKRERWGCPARAKTKNASGGGVPRVRKWKTRAVAGSPMCESETLVEGSKNY
jgi:hypothetical protein